jgi:hypothetical protein
MTDTPHDPDPAPSVVSIWPPLAVIVGGIAIWIVSGSYSDEARQFPRAVAALLVILGLFDGWSRVNLPGRALVSEAWGASFQRREMVNVPPIRQELTLMLWMAGAFAGMATVGILVALPAFCFGYLRLRARRGTLFSLAIAAGLLAFEFAVFEWLLNYELYRGLLFTKGGIARW